MSNDETGPVSVAEVTAVVDRLRGLSARAADNGQQSFHFVLSMGAESLADNVEQVAHWGDDDE